MHPSPGPAERGLQPLRLQPGVDLRGALEQATRHRDMPAFVVCGVGSLGDARLRLADAAQTSVIKGPCEILSLSGSLTPDGAHLHMAVADAQGRVHGGHVVLGNVVRTTAELLLAWLPGWDLGREFDAQTGDAELVLRAASKGAALP
jgi:predicted DNA-binding protein with PD1-like motif